MSEPPDHKVSSDPTRYNGPSGSSRSGSGVPKTSEEEQQWLRRADEAEQRAAEREQARAALVKLGQQRDAAREENDVERADALTREKEKLAIEIKKRFGY